MNAKLPKKKSIDAALKFVTTTKGRVAAKRLIAANGGPRFSTDPKFPGRVIADYGRGRRVVGSMIDRRFVPDENSERSPTAEPNMTKKSKDPGSLAVMSARQRVLRVVRTQFRAILDCLIQRGNSPASAVEYLWQLTVSEMRSAYGASWPRERRAIVKILGPNFARRGFTQTQRFREFTRRAPAGASERNRR